MKNKPVFIIFVISLCCILSTGLIAFAATADTGAAVSNECSIITENGGDADINSNSVSTAIVEDVEESAPSSGGSGGGASRHIVRFEPNNGDEKTEVYVSHNKTVSSPITPVYEGYAFTGWFTDEDCTELYDFDTKVTSTFTLYGGWEAEAAESEDSNVFEDVIGHWAEEYIEYLHKEGALDGIADT
ncbi:MAG: InlB B-repeat-containing protein, partial [Clostridiales bacterium]|nr:InlB B-repeat-containing protein [Clostridiales bacterium]